MKRLLILCVLIVSLTSANLARLNAAPINETESENGHGVSGLPIPRFASLRTTEVNLRTGPGTRYPIEWVYTHKNLPIEIIAEYEVWRRVRDPDGSEGWVHKTALSAKRSVYIKDQPRELHEQALDTSGSVAHLEKGAVGQLLSCSELWCKVKFASVKGYLRKGDFFGSYPKEIFN